MNPICKQMIEFNLTGNIVPISWYKKIKKRVYDKKTKSYKISSQTDHLAIAILADILYWYRPVEIRDERTGDLIGYRQKFSSDKLQKSYKEYSNLFGAPKTSVKHAFDTLVHLNLIKRTFKNITTDNNMTINNVMFVEPNLDEIKKITYPIEKIEDNNTYYREEKGYPFGRKKDDILEGKETNTETTTENNNINISIPTHHPSFSKEKEYIYSQNQTIEENEPQEKGTDTEISTNTSDSKPKDKLPSFPLANKSTKSSDKLKQIVKEVIEYLNSKVGKHYRPQNQTYISLISGRLREGYTLNDFKKVIDNKVDDWLGTDMEKYLRPATLFAKSHFDEYLNQQNKSTHKQEESLWETVI